ncbi:type I glyceraldehyde-3-phosphate dehydrogenase [Vulcanibacillus modesticaldus]|uniref:Glyceraldehyde-3-phosphate dehydrogenase n=1 Tax=Vulcanibacillus modesticaldus TaxID=337097 RepID=A0A1D2YSX1_9BACI|nr:glyceraldehyde-3-phosphate dehydrogenase [Vulcanibacillus modesticaldus]OEF98108.1 type I glyceraldehyde-3-phosphate dehydrogenase [Vulcanibacillus modesticaldus]
MPIKIAINGFGRIGRMVYRRTLQDPDLDVVAVNASYTPKQLAHMLKYDSVHGKLDADIKVREDRIIVDGKETKIISERDPEKLPWKLLDIEVVIEATGKFRDREGASKHLKAGAKKVIITAPAKNEDVTIVMGVNEEIYDHKQHHIISNASCTTNCLAPIVKVLHDNFYIEQGMMTTVHSYTNDQRVLDNMHKDLRRARSAGQSIIPTTTGAAKAVSLVLPELSGKLNGIALRVPTPDVSIVDLVVNVREKVTVEKVNEVLKKASQEEMRGILDYTEEPLVSVDFLGNDNSSIIDGLSTMVVGENQIKVMAWYDNEWGYSCRVVDLAKYVSNIKVQKRDNKILTA